MACGCSQPSAGRENDHSVQLEVIEQNNQILDNLGSLSTKMDSMSSRVDSVGSGVQLVQEKVQDIIEQQDSHNKKVLLVTIER